VFDSRSGWRQMKRAALPRRLTPPETRTSVGGLYSATLFFEFCVFVSGKPGDIRTCEKRIVLLEAASARSALAQAKAQGSAAQFRYKNTDGNPVHFRFVGVMDLCHLGTECAPNEVWYALCGHLRPMERKKSFIPRPENLSAIRSEAERSPK
jgi:hypothetical protein